MEEAEARTVAVSLEGDCVVIQKGEAGVKPGMIFVEAKLKDDAYGWDAAKVKYLHGSKNIAIVDAIIDSRHSRKATFSSKRQLRPRRRPFGK